MDFQKINYAETGKFSKLVLDYINQSETLKPFYNRFPKAENFEGQLLEKSNFSQENRKVLVQSLHAQYTQAGIELNKYKILQDNILSLENNETFTVTTGHQLCFMGGPLYFILKICAAINLAKEIGQKHPEKRVVPVFWMASEDHDFEEINHFKLFGKTYSWNQTQGGAVGRLKMDAEIQQLLEELKVVFGTMPHAETLYQLFEKAYAPGRTLAEATRIWVNGLFAEHGLVIIDGDDEALKQLVEPIFKREIESPFSDAAVQKQTSTLESAGYSGQVFSRPINLFKLSEGNRERIQSSEEGQNLSAVEISPNVILRPVYQEVILPNIAYIGGGAEVAYWMQLKTVFETVGVEFPMVVLRPSALFIDSKSYQKWLGMGFNQQDLFEEEHVLIRKFLEAQEGEISFAESAELIKVAFEQMELEAVKHDVSLKTAVLAEYTKASKSIEMLESKVRKAQKAKHENSVNQIGKIKNQLFPDGGLQERSDSFIAFYLKHGQAFIDSLIFSVHPSENQFTICVL